MAGSLVTPRQFAASKVLRSLPVAGSHIRTIPSLSALASH